MIETRHDNDLLDQAIDWVALLRSGRATTDDADRLQRWRAMSPEHDAAFKTAARMYRELGTMGAELERRQQSAAVRMPAARQINRRALIGGALAASVAGYMVVKPPLDLWPSLAEMSADYRTGKGEQLDVALADNVSLKLGTLTSISVQREGNSPKIQLISGEAAVTARRQDGNPLVVLAMDGQIASAAGEFDIRCIDGAVRATCLQGSITVTRGGRSVQLQSGQQIAYSAGEPLGAPTAVSDTSSLTAWKERLLIFRDQPLSSVVSEINRYRPGRIVVTDAGLGRRLVSGTFHTDQLDDFVAQVRQLYAVNVRSLPGGLVFLG